VLGPAQGRNYASCATGRSPANPRRAMTLESFVTSTAKWSSDSRGLQFSGSRLKQLLSFMYGHI
jgi:hypothetical protein